MRTASRFGLSESAGLRILPGTSGRLNALRSATLAEVLAMRAKQHRSVKVTTYALAASGADAAAAHAALAAHAAQLGWRVSSERFTDAPVDERDARPEFDRACRHAAAGFADGVLAPGRTVLPADDVRYESQLRWLRERLAFLAYLPTHHGSAR